MDKIIDTKPLPKKAFQPKITATITKNDFHPVKDIINDLEKDKSPVSENKTDIVQDNKVAENNKINLEEMVIVQNVIPPKPLPRTSRTGSICETLDDTNNTPKPVARPRTNSVTPIVTSVNPNVAISGGYKVIFSNC